MPSLDMKVVGLSALIVNTRSANQAIQRGAVVEVRRYGTNTKVDAQIYARVDTGKMRDAIEDTYSERGLVCSVGWDYADFVADGSAPHFIYNELGTSRMSAQPMIRPAHAKHAPILSRNIGDLMRKEVSTIRGA